MIALRLWLIFTLFIHAQFDFTSFLIRRSISHESLQSLQALQSGATWTIWLGWLLAAGIAFAFIKLADVRERLAGKDVGQTFATIGIAILVAVGIWAAVQLPPELQSGKGFAGMPIWFVAVLFVGAVAKFLPFLILGQAMLVIGALRMLFNLGPKIETGPYGIRVQGAKRVESLEGARQSASVAAPIDRTTGAQAASESSIGEPSPQRQSAAEEISSLQEQVAAHPSDPRLHDRLHRLLAADPSLDLAMQEHARSYLAVLVGQARGQQALALLATCLQRNVEFKPNANQVAPIARLALLQKNFRTAFRIMNKFDRLNPEHPDTPDVYYLSARALRDGKNFAQALTILDVLIERYPDAAVVRDAKTLRQALRTHAQGVVNGQPQPTPKDTN